MSASTRRMLAAAAALTVLSGVGPVARGASERVMLAVDPSARLGPVNRGLVGFNWTPGSGAGITPLAPRLVRLDARLEEVSTGPGHPLALDGLLAEVAEVRATGAEPLVILSYVPAWLGAPRAGGRDPTRVQPADLDAWEALVHEVVRALATAGSPARWFEAWNEPDNPIFWQDTPAAWVETAARSARAIARVERETGIDLAFAGPATLGPDPVYLMPFLARFRDPALPLDAVTWHWYGNHPFLGPDGREPIVPEPAEPVTDLVSRPNPAASPASFGPQPGMMRAWTDVALAGSGRPPPVFVLDEWNLSAGGFDRRHDSHEGAAFAAGVLAELQDAGLDASVFYRAADVHSTAGDWGALTGAGQRKPVWWTFWLWQQLGPERVALRGPSARDGLWGVAATGPAGRVTVMVASFSASQPRPRRIELVVPGASSASVRRIDATHADASVPEPLPVAGDRVLFDLPSQAVAFVEVTIT